MRNKRRLIPIIAATHFAISAVVCVAGLFLFFSDNRNLAWVCEALNKIGKVLVFPIFPLSDLDGFLSQFGWYCIPVLLIANSFIWAIGLYGIAALCLKIKDKGKRPKPAPLSLFCFFALLSVYTSALAQKSEFSDVPLSHWVYSVYPRLVKAKIASYPTCCYPPPTKPRTLTRYELAIVTIRANEYFTSQRKLTPEQTQLLPILRRMAREFAPEIRQLRPPQKRRSAGV